MRKQDVVILMLGVLLFSGGLAKAQFTTLPIYGSNMDIDGSNIVAGNQRYNVDTKTITTYTLPSGHSLRISGIDGDNLAGYDWEGNSLFYDGSSWAIITKSSTDRTVINDIEGNYLVGAVNGKEGFLYHLTDGTWTSINKSGAFSTIANGISGNNIIGEYYDDSGQHSFLYDMIDQTWTTLNVPGATYGISGNNIIGAYQDSYDHYWHGFLYDISSQSWTSIDVPNATATFAYGVDGDYVVGAYGSSSGLEHGFLYTIPEPTSILIFSFCALILSRKHTA